MTWVLFLQVYLIVCTVMLFLGTIFSMYWDRRMESEMLQAGILPHSLKEKVNGPAPQQ